MVEKVDTGPCGKAICLKRYNFFKELKIYVSSLFMDNCYAFPVVYTDGLVSYLYKDSEGRTPYGIEIYDQIILLNDADKKMTVTNAREYCKNIHFAGFVGSCPSIDVLWFISKKFSKINHLIKKLGGTPFKKGLYCSSNKVYYTKDGRISYETNPKAKCGYLALDIQAEDTPPVRPIDLDKTFVYVRPALKL